MLHHGKLKNQYDRIFIFAMTRSNFSSQSSKLNIYDAIFYRMLDYRSMKSDDNEFISKHHYNPLNQGFE